MTAAPELTDTPMATPPVTLPAREEVLAAIERAVGRLADDLGSIPAQAWSRPACGQWNVDQTVAHLSLGPIAYSQIIEQMAAGGVAELFDVTDPELTDGQTELMGEAEPHERIESVRGAFDQYVEAAWSVPIDKLAEPTWTPEAIMPTAAALAIGLNELVIHGYEIRVAAGVEPLPDEGNPAALAAFTLHACSGLIRQGGWSPIEVRLGGADPVALAWIDDGVVVGADVRPEIRIEATAGVFALLLWGRLTLADASASYGVTIAGPLEDVDTFFSAATPF